MHKPVVVVMDFEEGRTVSTEHLRSSLCSKTTIDPFAGF